MQSAATRRASARTAEIADSRLKPYAITPGMDSMSAHHRPSSSRPTKIETESTVVISIRASLSLYCLQSTSRGPFATESSAVEVAPIPASHTIHQLTDRRRSSQVILSDNHLTLKSRRLFCNRSTSRTPMPRTLRPCTSLSWQFAPDVCGIQGPVFTGGSPFSGEISTGTNAGGEP